jgi:uncharacterized membrane protein YjjB (DUF3815 family)
MLYFIRGEIDRGISTGIKTLLISGVLAVGIIMVSSTVNLIRKVMLRSKVKPGKHSN